MLEATQWLHTFINAWDWIASQVDWEFKYSRSLHVDVLHQIFWCLPALTPWLTSFSAEKAVSLPLLVHSCSLNELDFGRLSLLAPLLDWIHCHVVLQKTAVDPNLENQLSRCAKALIAQWYLKMELTRRHSHRQSTYYKRQIPVTIIMNPWSVKSRIQFTIFFKKILSLIK